MEFRQTSLLTGSHARSRGFSLVVSLSVMAMLVLIMITLFSLLGTAIRSADIAKARTEAQANARMSMMLALGELQQLAGLDTRITAGSDFDIVSGSNVRATGVWRSWEGTDRDEDGLPIAPDYTLKSEAGDSNSPLGVTGDDPEGRFLGWLASPMSGLEPDAQTLNGLSSTPSPGSVPLVASGSVEDAAEHVHATTTRVEGAEKQGTYAWWISGDNQKAMLNVDPVDPPDSTVDWHTRMKSNGRADPEYFGLEELDELPKPAPVPNTASFNLIDTSNVDMRKFHDFTAFNRGLLTNSANGGWRRDLSLFSENYSDLPDTSLPSLTLKPGQIQTSSKAAEQGASGLHPPNALLYPWANYRKNSLSGVSWSHTPPVCSWTALTDFMLQYKNVISDSPTRTAMPVKADGLETGNWRFEYLEQVRRAPVIARVQWIFSLCSRQNTDPSDPSNTYQAGLLFTPVVTLWNPYNVELRMDNYFYITFDHIAPLSFTFRLGDNTFQDTTLNEILKTSENQGGWKVGFRIDIRMPDGEPIILAPGATRIFGINDPVPVEDAIAVQGRNPNIILEPGYRPNGGLLFYGLNEGNDVYGTASDVLSVVDYGYSGKVTRGNNPDGLGVNWEIYLDTPTLSRYQQNRHGFRTLYPERNLAGGGDDIVDALYPSPGELISATLQEVEGIRNQPFASATLGMKPATPRPLQPQFERLHTKGMLNNHPHRLYTELGDKAFGLQTTGIYHPANSPYDFTFQDVNGWNDTQATPQFDVGTNSGYIISGLTAGDGLTRCVVAELPTRPVQSLAELQHFDATNNKPFPPFQFNLIGNGTANPIFAPNQVRVNRTNSRHNFQYYSNDDTFILNHLLFDDWFVSSIAPDLVDFSRSEERSIKRVYEDHLNADVRLPNRFYVAAPDADLDFPVDSGAPDATTGMYSYESVASQLEVEGMINVNSTSVEAWKAWLRQGRNADVPYLDDDGSTRLDEGQSFAFPRTSIAGDSAAGSGSSNSNPDFPDADEFAGYRTLTETQIDALAEEIVNEVRQRGPFLSLAEFVNRRLTNDRSLAAASAIQQALDTLAEDSSSERNPFFVLQQNSVEITEEQPGVTDHRFPEVALGSTAFGVPGWIRQADILTRLAPMLSVRDDTFTIRAYGDVRASDDSIVAQSWCEAVVRRRANYVDPVDPSQYNPHSTEMVSEINRQVGRRFEIVSFRWLEADEI